MSNSRIKKFFKMKKRKKGEKKEVRKDTIFYFVKEKFD